ncbi:MAG: metallopeptidase family protein [Rhodospirillales bacterium]|nr:metallopeptidase family protein [Rhodospirillales bacterium]
MKGTLAPDAEAIATIAERALEAIPERLGRHVPGVGIMVDELADDETLHDLGIESPYDLTGLYDGLPWGEKDSGAMPTRPDTIHLYRQAILLEWIETGETLERLVRNVLIHEIAHHFGFSDAAIARLEREG